MKARSSVTAELLVIAGCAGMRQYRQPPYYLPFHRPESGEPQQAGIDSLLLVPAKPDAGRSHWASVVRERPLLEPGSPNLINRETHTGGITNGDQKTSFHSCKLIVVAA